jgi:hypothetical protein|tara:strand:+ start:48 stop:761 length:714 start_codon:yes stop_codon:yes gene_type:complete
MDFYYLLIVIVLFGSIQSVVGLGLLLFGTPMLLILGYSYIEALWILLPASCFLSLFQILENYKLIQSKKEVYFFTIPALLFSLILIIKLDYLFDIKRIVGVFLLSIAILRLTNLSDKWAESLITKGKNLMYLLIGFVHGLSNLGGAPLTVLASSIYKDNKKISSNIAFVYFVLAISQLIVLYTYKSELFVSSYLIFIPVVILNHLVLRKILFRHIDNSKFKIFINLVILTFGVICVA